MDYDSLTAWLWMADQSVLNWMLAVGITLLLVDLLFFDTDLLTLVAMALFAWWGTVRINPPTEWSVFTFIIFLLLWAIFYYVFWKLLIRSTINRAIKAVAPKDHLGETLPGKTGHICGNHESRFIKIEDQIFPISARDHAWVEHDELVRVTAFKDGAVFVEKIK